MKSQQSGKLGVSPPLRRTRSDGERSRSAILLAATKLATTRGLAGMSIGDLADHIGMSKSGLYAHFRSKEELELATIDTAVAIFMDDVVQPARAARPGVARLFALADAFFSHLSRHVFPGGCFFASVGAELDTRPGRARDRVIEFHQQWESLIEQCLHEAVDAGEIDRHAAADVSQMTFEVQAMLLTANFAFVMTNDQKHFEQARRGIERAIGRAAKHRAAKTRSRPRVS